MRWRVGFSGWAPAIFCAVLVSSAALAQDASAPAPAVPGPGCHFGEAIDGSTADDVRRKIEAAGFADVRDLKKSCDNFWHGTATFTGRAVNVVLSPSGKVMLESD
jgi:hypothetical protein